MGMHQAIGGAAGDDHGRAFGGKRDRG